MPVADVVADANVALKWFHSEGEREVEDARALLDRHRARTVALHVLDLTPYELANALMLGQARATADAAATVLDSLRTICPTIAPDPDDLRLATQLAAEHRLSFYDAAYAAVAKRRGATLVTVDTKVLRAGLGARPGELLESLPETQR